MKLFPAIDLKDGNCVRLKKGEFNDVTIYSHNPWEFAIQFEKAGASYIHLVDLDGALEGHSVNEGAIRKIVNRVSIPCELGGGIRNFNDIERVLGYGVSRVIIGTKAVSEPEFVKQAVKEYGSRCIVVGIDARNGMVATHGWEQTSSTSAIAMALQMKSFGVETIIYTDINRDGMLSGPNVEMTKRLTDETGLFVVASGGVSSMQDLEDIANAGIKGAIIGKAYYEKKIDLTEAVKRFDNE